MADYRDHYPQLRSAGANLVAVSVDTATESEALRTQLSLPFPILCDTERHVIRAWDLLNARQKGGIAKPSVFVIDPGLTVRYAAIDTTATRVSAAEILSILQTARTAPQIRRKIYWPRRSDWMRALRNALRKH